MTNFRLGCTPRRFHRGRQEWVNGPTQWYGVSAWRLLGEHCKRSLHVGDPVIVHGRLNQRSYDRDGVEVTVLEIEAVVVGHDLTRGDQLVQQDGRRARGATTARRSRRCRERRAGPVGRVDGRVGRGRGGGGRRRVIGCGGHRDRFGDPAPVPATARARRLRQRG